MDKEIIIVTGSRMFDDRTYMYICLDKINPDIVVHGGAVGADELAHAWCKKNGKIAVTFYPNYDLYGKGAPLRRNESMCIKFGTAAVLGFPLPSSRGTFYTMKFAEDLGMEVINMMKQT